MTSKRIVIFYDGWCPFCKSTIKKIKKVDIFKKIAFLSLRDREVIEMYSLQSFELETEMHSLNLKTLKIVKGYDSLISISKQIPFFYPLLPIMFGLKVIGLGDLIYKYIASKRTIIPLNQCDKECKLDIR